MYCIFYKLIFLDTIVCIKSFRMNTSFMIHTCISLADRWKYSALYDKSMKLVTLILGIVGNVLKIRGNLDRICGSWEGEGDFSIWLPFSLLLGKWSKINLIQCWIVILVTSSCCISHQTKHQHFSGDLTEIRV